MSPNSQDARCAIIVHNSGVVTYNNTYSVSAVLPSVYLKSDVSISGGNGSETEPYELR